jgi:PTH1 family peptidyl-tRNA hydrolase
VKAIIGLGNPGLKYIATRHNVGFLVVRHLARVRKIRLRQRLFHSLSGRGRIGACEVLLGLPNTYMNLSGEAVAEIVKAKKIALEDLLVVCDDINLPLGKMRIRPRGSDGGHKGLRSIIKELGSEDFSRLRVGIGLPQHKEQDLSKYVLARFKRSELKSVEEVVEEAARASQVWVQQGVTTAMNKFN